MELNSAQPFRYHLIQYSKIFVFTVLLLSLSLLSWNYLMKHSHFVNTSHLVLPVVQLCGVEELHIPEYFWPLAQDKSAQNNTLPIQLDTINKKNNQQLFYH